MAKKPPSPFPFPPKRIYLGANIPMRVTRRYARAIAEEFRPDPIILFGPYAYGTPNEDSDVDLLVILPVPDEHAQSVRIRWRLSAPFPLDLLVRTPKEMAWRLKEGESFSTMIVSRGKILYSACVAPAERPRTRLGSFGKIGPARSPSRRVRLASR